MREFFVSRAACHALAFHGDRGYLPTKVDACFASEGRRLEVQEKSSSRRVLLLSALALTIACGLALRRFGYEAHLPFTIVKYGGSILWGSMVYFLLASLRVTTKPGKIAVAAALIAIFVEFFRLVHAPWLDAFRLTTAGALLLGRVFSLWNILAYAAGIGAALALDAAFPATRGVRQKPAA